MFKINTKREKVINHKYEDFDLSVTVKFTIAEETDITKLQEFLNNGSDEVGGYQLLMYNLRTSIIACSGFADEEGNEIILDKSKSNFEQLQIAVFEAVRNIPEFLEKLITAYSNLNSKNS